VTVKIKHDPKRRHRRRLEEAQPEKFIDEVEIIDKPLRLGRLEVRRAGLFVVPRVISPASLI
jgi:hypothetical protein